MLDSYIGNIWNNKKIKAEQSKKCEGTQTKATHLQSGSRHQPMLCYIGKRIAARSMIYDELPTCCLARES